MWMTPFEATMSAATIWARVTPTFVSAPRLHAPTLPLSNVSLELTVDC